jgi:hypothetical protein
MLKMLPSPARNNEGAASWKDSLNLPAKDARPQTEVRWET